MWSTRPATRISIAYVAIKVLPADKVSDPERKQRFVQEAKAASALNHPNIVTVHDIRSDSGIDFIVMEHAEGRTLDQIIRGEGSRDRAIPSLSACRLPTRSRGRTKRASFIAT